MPMDIIFLAAAYVAAAVATLAGFGSSTLLIPVAVIFIDPKTAIFLVACFHLFNNTFKIKAFREKIDARMFVFFGVPSVVFAFTGAMLVSAIPGYIVKYAIAVFLLVFASYSLLNPGFAVNKTRISALAGGSLSGLFAGLIGLGGAIRSAFLVAFDLSKETYVGTSAMIAFVIDLTRIPTYLFTGLVKDSSYYVLLPFLALSAYLGVKTGKKFLVRIDQRVFRKVVLAAVMLAAIKLMF